MVRANCRVLQLISGNSCRSICLLESVSAPLERNAEMIAVRRANCPRTAAGSDGRCNTCLEFTRWGLKSQSFSWALIQAQCDLVEMSL
jgi:hypothetical protein